MAIPRVQLTKFYRNAIHCPFCGQKVLLRLEETERTHIASICKHTLFVCDDEGFEYRSDRLNEDLGLIGLKDEDILLPDARYDSLTNLVTICDAVKFALYLPFSNSLFTGIYVGFAPVEGEERMDWLEANVS